MLEKDDGHDEEEREDGERLRTGERRSSMAVPFRYRAMSKVNGVTQIIGRKSQVVNKRCRRTTPLTFWWRNLSFIPYKFDFVPIYIEYNEATHPLMKNS
jgi:hypothetical protein